MAKNLNLKTERTGSGGVRVSWTDVAKRTDLPKGAILLYPVFVLGGLVASIAGGFLVGIIWFAGTIGFPIFMNMAQEKPNSVTFEKDVTTHQGQSLPTADITRIEYGLETELTGSMTKNSFMGENAKSQTLLRFWMGDSYTHNISLNNWQSQVNHEIRNALQGALDAVRDADKQKEVAEKFGVVDEDGMPDY